MYHLAVTARSLVLLLPLFASACFVDRIYDDIPLERVWGRAQSPSFAACVFATPQIYDAISEPTMLVAAGDAS